MSKECTIKINDKLFKKLNNHEMNKKNIVTEALHQFFEDDKQNDDQDDEIVTTLKENVKSLKKEKKTLEMEKVCLLHENKNLQTRIDDLAQMYPSAVALLGKATESRQLRKNKWFFKK